MLEHDLAARDFQRRRTRFVGDLGANVEQAEHAFHADQRVPDLAIGEAQHVERLVELQQEGVDRDEVADRHRARDHAGTRHHHHNGEADRDDRALPDIEQRQGSARADRGDLIGPAADVVAARLVRLVAEIFHRLVVDQAVDRLGIGFGVGVVHAAHELDAPFRQHDGEDDIACDHRQGDGGETPIVEVPQHDADQGDLEQGRQDVEGREADQELHALRAALDDAAEAAGLPLEMEAQAERMQVPEHLQGEIANRSLRHRCEDGVADFAEGLRQHAGRAIGQDQEDRDHHRLRARVGQGVDGLLVEDRDVDVGDLGDDQQGQGDEHPGTQAPLTLWPQMAPKDGQHFPRPPDIDGGWTIVGRGRHVRPVLALRLGFWGVWPSAPRMTLWVALWEGAFYRADLMDDSPL